MTTSVLTQNGNISINNFTNAQIIATNTFMPVSGSPPLTPSTGNSIIYLPNTFTIAVRYSNTNIATFNIGNGANALYYLPTTSGTLVDEASTQTISGKTVSQALGNNISATSLRGVPVSISGPVNGHILQYNGTQYVPSVKPANALTNYWVLDAQYASGTFYPVGYSAGYSKRTFNLNASQSCASTNITSPSNTVVLFQPGVYRVMATSMILGNTSSTSAVQLLLCLKDSPSTIYIYGQSTRNAYPASNRATAMCLDGIIGFNSATECNLYSYSNLNIGGYSPSGIASTNETYLTMYIEQL